MKTIEVVGTNQIVRDNLNVWHGYDISKPKNDLRNYYNTRKYIIAHFQFYNLQADIVNPGLVTKVHEINAKFLGSGAVTDDIFNVKKVIGNIKYQIAIGNTFRNLSNHIGISSANFTGYEFEKANWGSQIPIKLEDIEHAESYHTYITRDLHEQSYYDLRQILDVYILW